MNGLIARANFEKAVQLFYNAFVKRDAQGRIIDPNFDPIQAFKLTQSTIRCESPLSTASAFYQYSVLTNVNVNGQTTFNTEMRLNQQDIFVPTELKFFICLPASSTASNFKLFTYEAPFIFSAAMVAQIPSLYNGRLEILVNKDTKLTNWDMWRHYYAPQTQQTAAPGAGSPVDMVCGADDGFYPMEPYVLFQGMQGIQINLYLQNALTTVDANSRSGFLFRGVLAQNSTVAA